MLTHHIAFSAEVFQVEPHCLRKLRHERLKMRRQFATKGFHHHRIRPLNLHMIFPRQYIHVGI